MLQHLIVDSNHCVLTKNTLPTPLIKFAIGFAPSTGASVPGGFMRLGSNGLLCSVENAIR